MVSSHTAVAAFKQSVVDYARRLGVEEIDAPVLAQYLLTQDPKVMAWAEGKSFTTDLVPDDRKGKLGANDTPSWNSAVVVMVDGIGEFGTTPDMDSVGVLGTMCTTDTYNKHLPPEFARKGSTTPTARINTRGSSAWVRGGTNNNPES